MFIKSGNYNTQEKQTCKRRNEEKIWQLIICIMIGWTIGPDI